MATLDIIIPHHDEPIELMNGLLSSIDSSAGIDFSKLNIIIVNDDKNNIITDFSRYPNITNNISQHFNDKSGYPGISRQIGIDNSVADYIMFCDADDQLLSCLVLYNIFNEILSGKDLYIYNFVHEIPTPSSIIYREETTIATWIFSKVFNRKFLNEHDCRFDLHVKYHEDSYFNGVVFMNNPDTKRINESIYLWKCNLLSITRKNAFVYKYSNMYQLVHVNDKLIEYSEKHHIAYRLYDIMFALTAFYLCCQSNNPTFYKYKKDLELATTKLIYKYKLNELLDYEVSRVAIMDSLRTNENNNLIPVETIYQFVERLLRDYITDDIKNNPIVIFEG